VPHLTLEIRSPGRPRSQVPNCSYRSSQVDIWRVACGSSDEGQKFIKLINKFLLGKLMHYFDCGDGTFLFNLRELLTDDEVQKIGLAIQEIPRKRFEGADAPKTMDECPLRLISRRKASELSYSS